MLEKLFGPSPGSDDLVSACRAERRQKRADLFGRSQISCICLPPGLEQGIDPKISQEDSLENIRATAKDFCKQEQFEPFCYAKGPQRRMPLFTDQSLVREFAKAYFRRTKRSVPLQVLGVNGRARCLRLHAVLAIVSLLLCLVPASALAKQTAGREISSHSLPDEPPPKSGPRSSAQQFRSAEGSASVAGTVLDVSGAAVPGADVSLVHGDGTQFHTMVSEANGEFNFARITPGSYLVIVNAKGFAPFRSPEFDLTEQQTYEVPNVSLSVATANIEVT